MEVVKVKQILIAVIAIVGIIGIAMVAGGGDKAVGEQSNNFYGSENGIVTLTEYGDFECPACAGFYPIVSQVKEELKDQIRFEFKHFPLVQIHANATAAHRAAQAASNQGKFWEMHDLLYERQNSWNGQSGTTNPSSVFEEYAREIGLDMDQYTSDANSSETLAVINADVEAGKSMGANSTPTFYIDGTEIEDLSTISTVDGFKSVLEEAINSKQGSSEANSDEQTEEETEDPDSKPENVE